MGFIKLTAVAKEVPDATVWVRSENILTLKGTSMFMSKTPDLSKEKPRNITIAILANPVGATQAFGEDPETIYSMIAASEAQVDIAKAVLQPRLLVEGQAAPTPKKHLGWPKGKPRKPVAIKKDPATGQFVSSKSYVDPAGNPLTKDPTTGQFAPKTHQVEISAPVALDTINLVENNDPVKID